MTTTKNFALFCAAMFSANVYAHPGPPHTHSFGDEWLHLLPVVFAVAIAVWLLRRRAD